MGHCSHSHSHEDPLHHPTGEGFDRAKALKRVFMLTALYMGLEIIGGLVTGSLALLSDAGHMFADVVAILVSLSAVWLAQTPTTTQRTYGLQRIEILAGLMNGLLLMIMSLWIILESTERFQEPPELNGGLMFWVALGGLIINIFAMQALHGGKNNDLNIQGAYLHVLGDLLGSVGTVAAACAIYFWGWQEADPIISVLISLLLIASSSKLIWQSINVLLESSPAHIDVGQVKSAILALPDVLSLHDLHVWAINSRTTALTAHVMVQPHAYDGTTINRIQDCLKQEFGIHHVTIQLELPDFQEEMTHC